MTALLLCAYSPGAPAPKGPPQASVEKFHKAVADENHAEAKRLAESQVANLAGGLARRAPAGAAATAPAKPAGGEGARKSPTHSPDSRDSRAQLKSALESARAEALPYWLALTEKFPKTAHLPEALYHAGVLYSEGPGAKPDPEKSAAHFERLVKEFPTSPWTGDAHVRLIDVCLEQRFDLAAAERHAQAAVKWLDTVAKPVLQDFSRLKWVLVQGAGEADRW